MRERERERESLREREREKETKREKQRREDVAPRDNYFPHLLICLRFQQSAITEKFPNKEGIRRQKKNNSPKNSFFNTCFMRPTILQKTLRILL